MNLGLVTSFIIAGMLMLSILAMNLNLSTSSSDLTLSQITKQHVQTVTDMATYDIPKIGFAQNGKVTAYDKSPGNPYQIIEAADSNRIVFNSDIDNNGSIDQITWHFDTSDEITATNNPNDYVLVREVNGDRTEIRSGVTKFRINYYSAYGAKKADKMATPVTGAANLSSIRQIEVELVIESREKIRYSVGSDGRYVASAWEKRYTPRNLQED